MKNNSALVMKFHGLQGSGYRCDVPAYHQEKAGLEVDKIRRALGWKPQVSMTP